MSTEPSPTRAVVVTAAVARSLLIRDPPAAATLRLEDALEARDMFEGMQDSDLAVLMGRLETELHERGWRPTRQWARADPQPV